MNIIGELAVELLYLFPDTLQGRTNASQSSQLFHQVIKRCAGENVVDPPIITRCSVRLHAVCPVTTRSLAHVSLVELGEQIKREYITKHLATYGAILVQLCFVTYAVRQC